MHGLLRCNINAYDHAYVYARGRSGRVTQGCHNSPDGKRARECGWRHRLKARRGFGGFWKSQLVELSSDSGEDGWLSLARRSQASDLEVGATRVGGGGWWKSHHRKIVHLPSLCRSLKLKGNKRFRTWTTKLLRVFRVSGFLCSMYICYEHCMYVSHIHIWLWSNWMNLV